MKALEAVRAGLADYRDQEQRLVEARRLLGVEESPTKPAGNRRRGPRAKRGPNAEERAFVLSFFAARTGWFSRSAMINLMARDCGLVGEDGKRIHPRNQLERATLELAEEGMLGSRMVNGVWRFAGRGQVDTLLGRLGEPPSG